METLTTIVEQGGRANADPLTRLGVAHLRRWVKHENQEEQNAADSFWT